MKLRSGPSGSTSALQGLCLSSLANGLGIWGLGFRDWGLGFRDWGLGFGKRGFMVKGLEFS